MTSCSSMHMAAPPTKPADATQEDQAWGKRWLEEREPSAVCRCVELEATLPLQSPSPFRQSQSALPVSKCSCFPCLGESHFLPSCPDCKSPFGMATISLEHIPDRSFSVGDETLCPSTARRVVLLVGFLLGIVLQPWMLGQGHCLLSLLCAQLVLEGTPTLLLRIGQPRDLMAA